MKGCAKSFLLFFVLLSKSVCCQFNGEFIKGVLLDEESNEPVVFATVRLKGRALGVISNNDGGFKVPIEFQLKGGGLEISSMGYESQSISFAELKKNVLNKIYLRPSVFQLNETTVKARKKRRPTAKQIIRFALNRIPGNYQNNPFQLIGYYRDYQLKDEKYINLNESLIKVMDQGFAIDDYQSIQFGLYGYKKNYDFAIDSFAAKPYDYATRDKFIPNVSFGNSYISNELVLLFIHDAIRNHGINTYSFVYNMVDDFIKEHRFSRVKNVTYGDQKVYQIDFDKVGISFQVKGAIYIDEDNYAIRKFDYALYKQKPDDSSPTTYSSTEKDLLYEILVEYNDFEERMYLNYISFHNQFKLIRPPEFFIDSVVARSNYGNMEVFLNKPYSNWHELDVNDFQVFYQGKKLKLERVYQIEGTASRFMINFQKKTSGQKEQLNLLFSDTEDQKKSSFEIYVDKLIDTSGNRLGERESEIMDQFREFFTQRVETDGPGTSNEPQLVDKLRSLGHPQQPITSSENSDFWMNTPLKSKE